MTVGLTEEHHELRDSVRALSSRHVTSDVIRQAVDAKTEQLPAFWPRLADQELLGLHLPETVGGAGYGLLELAVVVEELGRGMVPGPYLPTVLASAVLHHAGHDRLLPELAAGTGIATVALHCGSLTLTRTGTGAVRLSGEPDPVLGGHLANHFVLPARDGGSTSWVVLPRSAVETADLDSHDPTRGLSRVRADDVSVAVDDVLDIAAQTPFDLAATLFAAEASGMADWASTTAADYAKVRHQFGRPVGQFQGVKHRCARILTQAEQARVCAWDAARSNQPGAVEERGQASLAAAVAGATSVEAGFSCAKACIQTLGGIGFTWEHDANLYLRRSQTLRLLLGSTGWWRRRVARLTLAGTRRDPGVELPPEAAQVREGIRAELAPVAELGHEDRLTYLAEHGYTAPHLTRPWGKGADAVSQLVIAEELRAAELEAPDMVIGAWVVPTLIAHGSYEQQRRFLPATLRGDVVWCQLFSEPGAGSDLAGLATRAEKVDGGWKINGQKVWTSMAGEAHHGILLARTDSSVPKHRGLSYFVVDMAAPGIDVRPLREITGDALFNEVFFDDVFVPDEMLVAEPGDGWKLARTTLSNERVSLSQGSSLGSGGETLLAIAAGTGFDLDDERSTTLGGILCDAQSGRLFGLRTTLRSLSGQQPGAESSVAKLISVEHVQQVWETAMDWSGAEALSGNPERPGATWMFLNSRCMSIAGGTTDVQLNIIGERLLGLPRDPEPSRAQS